MKHLFIVNPVAGRRQGLDVAKKIDEYFSDKNENYEIFISEYEGHATEFLKNCDFEDFHRVYSVGGDGTLNEVLNGVANKENFAMGIIPFGTCNDFYKNYGPKKLNGIIEKTIEGSIQEVDIGTVNDRVFLNIASVGFDALVARNVGYFRGKIFIPGPILYVFLAIYTLFKYKPQKVKYEYNNKIYEKEIFFLALANGKYYGGGKKLAPNASINDDDLELYVVDACNKIKAIYILLSMLFGINIKHIKGITYGKCNNIKVFSEKYSISNIDGEIYRSKKFEFGLRNKPINLILPKK